MGAQDFAVREAAAGDIDAAVALLRAQLAEHAIELAPAALARAVRGMERNAELGRVLVARAGERVVGVAVLSFLWTLEHGGASAWLDELYVEPVSRGRGIGRALAEAAIAVAEAADCIALDLEVEPGHDTAVRLYERLGFHRHERERWVRPLARARSGELATPDSRDRRPFASLDHLSLGVGDLARSKAFYDAALAPLGLVAHATVPGEIAYAPPGERPVQGFAFYIGFEDPAAKRPVAPSAGFHLALRAPSRESVRRFHAAGLANGGRDLGAPGLRQHYHADYYGAFLADPDGHHIEAVCHAPERTS
jgi:ribosomal protein S18 acetylase RimI-like enzyme/catechol 2,3-dioxygenase-like lactoylglutathione lyase family enzyme